MEIIENYITERQLAGDFVDFIRSSQPNLQERLAQLISALNPSGNTLREIVRTAEEIALRDGVPLSELLMSAELQSVLVSENLSFKDKQHKVKEWLTGRRFPILNRVRQRLAECQVTLRQDTGINFELPKDLEGDTLRFSLSVRSVEELRGARERLERATDHPSLSQMFKILKGESSL